MITVTYAQLNAWVVALMFPLSRVLGLITTAPVFSGTGIPQQFRVILGLVITIAIAPILPPMPDLPAASWQSLFVIAEQALIGAIMGLTLRIAFSAVDMAGDLIGLQMGLSFAVFYDPARGGQTPVVTEYLNLLATLLFLAMNGHLLAISALTQSFTLLPVSLTPYPAHGMSTFLTWSATLFSSGLLLSLPLVAALLIANISLGVLSRIAPTLNLFAVGFPVTLGAGLLVLMLSLPYFGAALEKLYERGFSALEGVVMVGKPPG